MRDIALEKEEDNLFQDLLSKLRESASSRHGVDKLTTNADFFILEGAKQRF